MHRRLFWQTQGSLIDVQFGEHEQTDNVVLDSLLNIAVNKVTAIFGRAAIKDFVDLYE